MKIKKRSIVYNLTSDDIDRLSLIGVYSVGNKINDKKYIGSTTCKTGFIGRWSEHLGDLRKNNHHCAHLQNHVNKYGIESLSFSILEIVINPEDCRKREKYWIDYYGFKNTFNISKETDISIAGPTHVLFKEIDIIKAIKLHNEGVSTEEIAKIFNVSISKIKTTFYRNGIETLRRKKDLPLTEIYYRNLLGKESLTVLAKEYGLDKGTLVKYLKENGFKQKEYLILDYLESAKKQYKVERGLRAWSKKLPFDSHTFLTIIKDEKKD
jgi:group I intron endonuclease